jgi:hypothetical protein
MEKPLLRLLLMLQLALHRPAATRVGLPVVLIPQQPSQNPVVQVRMQLVVLQAAPVVLTPLLLLHQHQLQQTCPLLHEHSFRECHLSLLALG